MTAPQAYRRTKGGRMIHRANCPHAQTGIPWIWARGRGPAEIQAELRELGHTRRWCRVCVPEMHQGEREVQP
jgi:hypothetical protein